jgi:oligopeptide transport system permease protein
VRNIKTIEITATAEYWKILYPGTDAMPRYLFGTDDSGKDLLKYSFAGLRTSLLLGVITFVVNFTFGLIYGAIAGYFGGWTDILMERFTDILGGVPWIVVMTLMLILFGHTFAIFAIALCITGWIGTASLTRTQFYRFKSREYILAARTLGASDPRLIFRHILPNAVGTIVTSAVLMIPSVIFSEATLAYLNLGLQGMSSFGVILSDNQSQINTNPHLILFPSIIMALIMISFNLFGNGLRDAFNPSLKGGE